ncbi:MAG: heme-binding protein [Beijerinckiaceae bacterium]
MHRLPATLALEAVGEAVRKCIDQGNRVTATVVDIDGVQIATLRADGAGVHTLETSHAKALAAVSLAAPVLNVDSAGELAERFPPQSGFQAPAGMLFRPGGVVIRLGDEVIGAIGVGGSPKSEICALAGIETIRSRLK